MKYILRDKLKMEKVAPPANNNQFIRTHFERFEGRLGDREHQVDSMTVRARPPCYETDR